MNLVQLCVELQSEQEQDRGLSGTGHQDVRKHNLPRETT